MFDEEDAFLETTTDSVPPISSSALIVLLIDVCYDHAFRVPAPYVHGWYSSSGSSLSFDEMSALLNHYSQSEPQTTVTDHSKYDFGTWMPAIHPVSGRFCVSPHVCDLSRMLDPIVAEQDERLYMLSWFSLIVRYLGITMDPNTFSRWQSLISAECDT